jgi:hypothetical protein
VQNSGCPRWETTRRVAVNYIDPGSCFKQRMEREQPSQLVSTPPPTFQYKSKIPTLSSAHASPRQDKWNFRDLPQSPLRILDWRILGLFKTLFQLNFTLVIMNNGRSIGSAVWSAGLDHSYTGSRVRIPLKAWMFVLVFICCVVLCRSRPRDELVTRPRSPTICLNRWGNQKIRGGEGPKLDYRSQWRRLWIMNAAESGLHLLQHKLDWVGWEKQHKVRF